MKRTIKVKLKGKELLRDPLLNKGTAFTRDERRAFELEGLLPDHVSSIEEQIKRRYYNFSQRRSHIEKYEFLTDLHNRNEVLFYRLVLEHIHEMLPLVYTPTIGEASIQYSLYYNQSRGVFIPHDEQDKIETLLRNAKKEDVRVIVVTDGSRVLGLGDVGVGGMAIPIGKLNLYTLFGGIDPSKTLPIFLDAGTNNEELLKDPYYIGKHERRISEEAYQIFLAKFIKAVKKVYPNVLLQWEDFSKDHASYLLETYQKTICSFNDDIQGTAASVLAGLLSAERVRHKDLKKEKIALFGGGSAGMGIAYILVDYMKHLGISEEEAKKQIYIIDQAGLVHSGLKSLSKEHAFFARDLSEISSWGKGDQKIELRDVIEHAKITILIGASAQKDTFDKEMIQTLCKNTEHPVVFPLSNPNYKCEILPKDLYEYSEGKAIIATGSPFAPVEYKEETHFIEQCNNVFVFPAIGLATSAVKFKEITQEMFFIIAEELSKHAAPQLFPSFSKLRSVTKEIAKAIICYAVERGLAESLSQAEIDERIENAFWYPEYAIYK